jgi:signal transduction histidine kinase
MNFSTNAGQNFIAYDDF